MSKVSDEKTEEKASEEKKAEYKGMIWRIYGRLFQIDLKDFKKLFHFGTMDFKLQNLSQRIKVSASQDSLSLWLIGMDVDKFTCKSMIFLLKYQCNMSPVFRSNDDWTETDKNRVNLLSTCALYQNSNDNQEHGVSHLLTVQTTIKLNTMQKPHPFSHPNSTDSVCW